MKTCSGGPYPAAYEEEPSFQGAIKWVLDKNYVHAAVVAMSNRKEIKEDVRAMG